MDLRQIQARGRGRLEAGEVGVHHAPVAVQAEDQGHVHADALADRLRDGRQAGLGGRDLDQDVLAIDQVVEFPGLGHRFLGLHRQARLDLDRDPAVVPLGGGEDFGEQIAGVADVGGAKLLDRLADLDVAQVLQLLGVVGSVGQGGGEDGGVGRHTNHGVLGDEGGQVARLDAAARQVIQPNGHSRVGQSLQTLVHWISPGSERGAGEPALATYVLALQPTLSVT